MSAKAPAHRLTVVSNVSGWVVEIFAADNLTLLYLVAIEDPDAAQEAARKFAKAKPEDTSRIVRALPAATLAMLELKPGEVRIGHV